LILAFTLAKLNRKSAAATGFVCPSNGSQERLLVVLNCLVIRISSLLV
jgi:hypothetical protein